MENSFMSKYKAALSASNTAGRMDFELHDIRAVDSGRAVRVLATYAPALGAPNAFDIQHWFSTKLGDYASKIQARAETIAVYPDGHFVTMIVESKSTRQAFSASAKMVKAGVNQYIDDSSTVWEVVKGEKGPQFLVKKENATIEQMLAVRSAALRGGASTGNRRQVTLAAVDALPQPGGGFATAGIGDLVEFYHDGLIHRGRIASANSTGLSVKTSRDTYTIDPHAVTQVIERSPAQEKEDDTITRRYFSLVYPGNPEMTKIISPLATGPVTDPRPLQVEPISAKVGASFRFTVRAPAAVPQARATNTSAKVPSKG
jgi:hypothetical protein